MNSIELTKTEDGTDQQHMLYHRFTKELTLPPQFALTNITLFHNWRNITKKLGTYWFKIIYTNAETVKNQDFYDSNRNGFTLPDGSYSIEDINNYIHLILNKIESLPHEEIDFTRDDFGINLYANSTFNCVSIEIKQNYTLELSNDLAILLGSDELQITESKNFRNIPNIENVLRIKVNCDLISDYYSTRNNNLLYSFTPTSKIGRIESPKINFPVWKMCRNTDVREIRVWLTDQSGRDLQFSDEWSVTLLFRNP